MMFIHNKYTENKVHSMEKGNWEQRDIGNDWKIRIAHSKEEGAEAW